MPHPLGGRRILVVEDAALIAAELVEDLEGVGAVVIGPAHNLPNALDLVNRGGIDAAVLDVNLGDTMSFPVAICLTQQKVPFLFTTGYDDGAVPDDYGEVPKLTKPAPTKTVLETLESLLIS
jgi:CheY-like chemotaxis protein